MHSPSRRSRLAAFFIDFCLILVPMVARYPGFPEAIRLLAAFAAVGVLVYQAWLLTTQGQTVGKRAYHLKIVRLDDGQNGGFGRNVALRLVLGRWLLGLIPLYLLVDALFIFREDRRCLHDLIAGTRVIATEEPAAA